MNYAHYLYTRPLRKEQMPSLLLTDGTAFLLDQGALEGSWKETVALPGGLGAQEDTDLSSGCLSSSCRISSVAWDNWPFFPTVKPCTLPCPQPRPLSSSAGWFPTVDFPELSKHPWRHRGTGGRLRQAFYLKVKATGLFSSCILKNFKYASVSGEFCANSYTVKWWKLKYATRF